MSESESPFRLLYFRADWCGVCHEKSPVVEEIAASAGLPLELVDWETEDGQKRSKHEVVAQTITFLPKRSEAATESAPTEDPQYEYEEPV